MEINIQSLSTLQHIIFTILCVKKVYKDTMWNNWADAWIEAKTHAIESMFAFYFAVHSDMVKDDVEKAANISCVAAYMLDRNISQKALDLVIGSIKEDDIVIIYKIASETEY